MDTTVKGCDTTAIAIPDTPFLSLAKIFVGFRRFYLVMNHCLYRVSEEKVAQSSQQMRVEAFVESRKPSSGFLDLSKDYERIVSLFLGCYKVKFTPAAPKSNSSSLELDDSLEMFERIGEKG